MRIMASLLLMLSVSACIVAPSPPQRVPSGTVSGEPFPRLAPQIAVANFEQVLERVEPVAEQVCREQTPRQNCDFVIAVERDPRAGVNAFQTVDPSGRPYIVFTLGLIADARNVDELAFVMGHEAAHHIAEHIPMQQRSAQEGAMIFGILAELSGADQRGIDQAVQIGATVGARRFSQDHELEADALGTIIAIRAGYDPLRGAEFFQRLPDPGNRFLGTHPPNAARDAVVRATAQRARSGT